MTRLQIERERRGWSRAHLAWLARIAAPTYGQIERGLIPVYPRWRERLAAALGVAAHELFGEREEASAHAEHS